MNTRPNGVIEIKKSELERMESAMEEGGACQNAVREIADSIPSDYSIEEIVNYATIQAAKVFMYDSNYEKSSMEEAVREKRGGCYHYARLLKSVLTEVGIESEFIIGYADHSDISNVWLKIRDEDQNRWIYREPTRTLDELKEQDMAGIDGSLKSKLSKTVRNRWKYKNLGYTHDQKGRLSYREAASPFRIQRLVVPFSWNLEA